MKRKGHEECVGKRVTRMDVEGRRGERETEAEMNGRGLGGNRDFRAKKWTTRLCGGNLSDTSNPHRSGKRCGGRREILTGLVSNW